MATLGQTGSGFTFTVNPGAGWGDFAGGAYTVPSPGIIVSSIFANIGNGGTAQNCRLYVWRASGGIPGTWLIRGAGTQSLAGLGWNSQSSLANNSGAGITSDLYLPAGTVVWIGAYLSAGSGQFQMAGTSGGGAELGNTSDGNWSDHGPVGLGQMSAYLNYTLLAAPTLSGASPAVAPQGQTTTITGTGLLHTTGITVCGVTASTYTINSDTSITVTVPAGASGAGSIVVTTPAGSASTAFTAGQIYWGNGTSAQSIAAVWYGDPSGNGTPHKVAGIWVPNGTGVKRIW